MQCVTNTTDKSIVEISQKPYEIKPGSVVSISHMSMMLYCNYDTLQSMFTATYRKTSETEKDGELKARRSNYFHFGKLLRELVECYETKGYITSKQG